MGGQPLRAFEQASNTEKRTFYHDHVMWVVGERPAPASDMLGPRHLVLESDGCIRRVRNFPAGWREFEPSELHELSWRT